MRVLQYLLDFVSHIFDFFRRDDPNIKRDQCIMLRPDGTWIISDKTSLRPSSSTKSNFPPPDVFIPRPTRSFLDISEECGSILEPPDFFPHKKELVYKLEQCVDINVVVSYEHSLTEKGTYILKVDLPCSTEDYSHSYNQFKLFIKAMEQKYGFSAIQQDRIISKTSSDKFHVVVFEFDPRKKIF